ncbi:MAG: 23S rRNA (uracil(1939)-C(5))-methyltransferase RlmD [Magnetococcales bacterium]|nr:23S rRNA (uracil(1939)-C(5))-methyltransferase RlmD [Magnetococcales bacterium]
MNPAENQSILEGHIERLLPGGLGCVSTPDGLVAIPGTAPGDDIRYEPLPGGGGLARGRLVEVLRPGPGRVEPVCPLYGECGGCGLMHLGPEAVCAAKRDFLVDSLRRLGRVADAEQKVAPLVWPDQPLGYRIRAGLKVHRRTGKTLLGFHAPESHRVVDLPSCPVLHGRLSDLLTPLRELISTLAGGDGLPQVDGVVGFEGVGLVFHFLESPSPADRQRLMGFSREQKLAGLWLQQGRKHTLERLVGGEYLHYRVAGMKVAFGPGDFIQGHAQENERLVATTRAGVGTGRGSLWDLFCGVGNLTIPLAAMGRSEVLGVESYAPALQAARHNGERENLSILSWRELDLFRPEKVASLPWGREQVVVMDPPRTGAVAVARYLGGVVKGVSRCERVVYVSCAPATLARDVAILQKGGWSLERVTPIEMFPHTVHVEAVAVLSR